MRQKPGLSWRALNSQKAFTKEVKTIRLEPWSVFNKEMLKTHELLRHLEVWICQHLGLCMVAPITFTNDMWVLSHWSYGGEEEHVRGAPLPGHTKVYLNSIHAGHSDNDWSKPDYKRECFDVEEDTVGPRSLASIVFPAKRSELVASNLPRILNLCMRPIINLFWCPLAFSFAALEGMAELMSKKIQTAQYDKANSIPWPA